MRVQNHMRYTPADRCIFTNSRDTRRVIAGALSLLAMITGCIVLIGTLDPHATGSQIQWRAFVGVFCAMACVGLGCYAVSRS